MRYRVFTNAGVTLIEVLIALFSLMLIQPVLLSVLHLVTQVEFAWDLRQNQLGTIQLRRKVAQGVKLSVADKTLSFDYDNKRISIECTEHGVYQQPGNMPYLIELTHCEWKKDDPYVVLMWSMGEERYELIIGILD